MSSATAMADESGAADSGAGESGAPDEPGRVDLPFDHERASPLMVGVVVWLTSELMFFGGLFAAWFTLRSQNYGNWPPPGEGIEPLRMLIGTALLITSSGTIHLCLKNTKVGNRHAAMNWLAATFALGLVFLVNEVLEWQALGFGFSASAFSTIFYLLTGFHGAHVLMGLVLMVLVGWVAYGKGTKVPPTNTMHAVGYYWHFVDVVWILLYLIVYVQTWANGLGH